MSLILSRCDVSAALVCSAVDLVHLTPPAGQTCTEYLEDYLSSAGGTLYGDAFSTTDCSLCTASTTNAYLTELGMSATTAWRDFGLMWAFVVFK